MLKRRPRTSPPRAKSGRPPQSWTTPATTDLFRTIAGLKSLEETERFFRDLCTIPELHTLSHRWEVAKLLDQGVHYADIAERTGAGMPGKTRLVPWSFGAADVQTPLLGTFQVEYLCIAVPALPALRVAWRSLPDVAL